MFVKFLLKLLFLLTGYDYRPVIPPPPDPPEPELPDWVLRFGDLDRYTPRWARSGQKAFFQVIVSKGPVFFEDPDQTHMVDGPDGNKYPKHVWALRTSPESPTILAPPMGARIPGYFKVIPTSTLTKAPHYSDGGSVWEICEPKGGIMLRKDVQMIGYIDEDGEYVQLVE